LIRAGTRSIPKISFNPFQVVLFQNPPQFVLKTLPAMMLLLIANVFDEGVDVALAD
jgi:hypothetical protein